MHRNGSGTKARWNSESVCRSRGTQWELAVRDSPNPRSGWYTCSTDWSNARLTPIADFSRSGHRRTHDYSEPLSLLTRGVILWDFKCKQTVSEPDEPNPRGTAGNLCRMDDVLIYGAHQAEHGSHLKAVVERLQTAGVTFNAQKCVFSKCRIWLLGHIIDGDDMHHDPQKGSAVLQMERAKNANDLRWFIGMANQLGKISQSNWSQPLPELQSTKWAWRWDTPQEKSFTDIKQELTWPAMSHLCTIQKLPQKHPQMLLLTALGPSFFNSPTFPGEQWHMLSMQNHCAIFVRPHT